MYPNFLALHMVCELQSRVIAKFENTTQYNAIAFNFCNTARRVVEWNVLLNTCTSALLFFFFSFSFRSKMYKCCTIKLQNSAVLSTLTKDNNKLAWFSKEFAEHGYFLWHSPSSSLPVISKVWPHGWCVTSLNDFKLPQLYISLQSVWFIHLICVTLFLNPKSESTRLDYLKGLNGL